MSRSRPLARPSAGLLFGRFGLLVAAVLILAVFSVLRPDTYGTLLNLRAMVDGQVVVVFVSLAALVPMIIAEFDLSIGAVSSVTAMLLVGLAGKQGLGPIATMVLAFAAGPLVGLVNGILVIRLRINAFVITLGTMTILTGVWLTYLNGETYVPVSLPAFLTGFASATFLGLPLPIYYAAAATGALWFFFAYLPIGRRMRMVGTDRSVARLLGIRPDRYVVGAFVASGTLAGFGGVVLGSQLQSVSPGAGTSLLIPALAAVFLGSTTIDPGRFNVLGTIVAVYMVAFLVSGLQQLGAALWVTPLVDGLALLSAVILSALVIRAREGRAMRLQLETLRARFAPKVAG